MHRQFVPVCKPQEVEYYETLIKDLSQCNQSFSITASKVLKEFGWANKIKGKLSQQLEEAKNRLTGQRLSLFEHRKALKEYIYLLMEHAKYVGEFQQEAMKHCMPQELFEYKIDSFNSEKSIEESSAQESNEEFLLQHKLGMLYPIHRHRNNLRHFLKNVLNTDCSKMKVEHNGGFYFMFSGVKDQFIQALSSPKLFEQFIRQTLLKEFLLQYQLAQNHDKQLIYTVEDYVNAIICLLVESVSEKDVCANAVKLTYLPNLVLQDGNLMKLVIQKIYQLTEQQDQLP